MLDGLKVMESTEVLKISHIPFCRAKSLVLSVLMVLVKQQQFAL